MADRRVTELVHGHVGQSSYDIHEREWSFSKDLDRNQSFQQILPFKQCVPPPSRSIPELPNVVNTIARLQLKGISKKRPEIIPARPLATAFAIAPAATDSDIPTLGPLLALGRAVDADHAAGSRTAHILAIPSGEAGHVLKIIKPRVEKHGWGKRDGVRLSVLNATSADQGHWVGTGGTIRQIAFADNEFESGTWLAVRQLAMTTIFRPVYRAAPKQFVASTAFYTAYPPSRLDPNPVAVLAAERSGSETHVDVSFNPWYSRQFGVIDRSGHWTIWDIGGRQVKQKLLNLVPGKNGHIYDGYVFDQDNKVPNKLDGWHRIIWVGSVSTVVVSNRRHLAVFDMNSQPSRLPCPNFMSQTQSDWIIDIKRSVLDISHLFILTTSRIFWLEVIPATEDGTDGKCGVNVLLSYRHFREMNDETMKLTVFKDNEMSVVLVSSSQNLLVNSFVFHITNNAARTPRAFQGSVESFPCLDMLETVGLQALFVLPTQFISSPGCNSGTGFEYMERGVKFHHTWILTPELGLYSALSATCCNSSERTFSGHGLVAPDAKSIQTSGRLGPLRTHEDSFVVPDGADIEDLGQIVIRANSEEEEKSSDLRLRINYRKIFQRAFTDRGDSKTTEITAILRAIRNQVGAGRGVGGLAIATCLELCALSTVSDELDDASRIIHEFLESLLETYDQEASELVVSNLTSCPSVDFSSESGLLPRLLNIYDQLIAIFVTELPLGTPGLVRLAKSQVVRKVAFELYLSSIAISLRSNVAPPDPTGIDGDSFLPVRREMGEYSRASSPTFFSSQVLPSSSQNPEHTLPTPASSQYTRSQDTSSLYSQPSASSTLDLSEDSAISRLLQYTYHIKPSSDITYTKSSILSHWPSTPGVDPATYSWEAIQEAAKVAAIGDEKGHTTRRENARRKKRAEKYLSQQRASAAERASQPTAMAFGSQPDAVHDTFSSQPVDNLPMTQPDRGVFGSRVVSRNKVKAKKRRAAGF